MKLPSNNLKEMNDVKRQLVFSINNEGELVDAGVIAEMGHLGKLYKYQLINEKKIKLISKIIHYLDKFWIIIPNDLELERLLWEEFYAFFGNEYEQLIDINHNINCLEYLIDLLEKGNLLNSESEILDFGCGTGLSTKIQTPYHMFGYDINQIVCEQAQKKGMQTLSEAEFQMIPAGSFDGCIASYVLHMAISREVIIKIKDILKPGGILVANYYKNIGAKRVNSILIEEGVYPQLVGEKTRYGSVYVYRK